MAKKLNVDQPIGFKLPPMSNISKSAGTFKPESAPQARTALVPPITQPPSNFDPSISKCHQYLVVFSKRMFKLCQSFKHQFHINRLHDNSKRYAKLSTGLTISQHARSAID